MLNSFFIAYEKKKKKRKKKKRKREREREREKKSQKNVSSKMGVLYKAES